MSTNSLGYISSQGSTSEATRLAFQTTNVAIGAGPLTPAPLTSTNSTCIGRDTTTTGDRSTAVGAYTSAAANGVVVGAGINAGANSVVVASLPSSVTPIPTTEANSCYIGNSLVKSCINSLTGLGSIADNTLKTDVGPLAVSQCKSIISSLVPREFINTLHPTAAHRVGFDAAAATASVTGAGATFAVNDTDYAGRAVLYDSQFMPIVVGAMKGLLPRVNVKDYGALGNNSHDDTANIQAALTAANTLGCEAYFPPGTYIITGGLTIDNTVQTAVFANRVSIRGDNPSTTHIIGRAGAYDMLTITGGTAAGWMTMQSVCSISLEKEDHVGACIRIVRGVYLRFEHVDTTAAEFGLHMSDVIASTFVSCNFRWARYGVESIYGTRSYGNALTFVGCIISNSYMRGIHVLGGANLSFIGGSIEGSGHETPHSGTQCGAYLEDPGVEGSASCVFDGVYFEGNASTADVWIKALSRSSAASFTGCSFNRINATNYVTNNIYLESGAGHRLTVAVNGCGFRHFNDYTPDGGRPYFGSFTAGGSENVFSHSGCLFGSATEYPVVVNDVTLKSECPSGTNTGATNNGTIGQKTITFTTALKTTPRVFTQVTKDDGVANTYTCEVYAVSASAFSVRTRLNGVLADDIPFNWFAIQ